MTRLGKIGTFVAVLYPFAVAAVLTADFSFKWIAFLPILAGFLFCLRPGFRFLAFVGFFIGGFMMISGYTMSVLWYPVMMNSLIAFIFAISLRSKPLISVFAERMGYILDTKGHVYVRRATIAWAIFMSGLSFFSLLSVFGPLWVWTVFNGCVSYILIGFMLAGEYLIRRRVMCQTG